MRHTLVGQKEIRFLFRNPAAEPHTIRIQFREEFSFLYKVSRRFVPISVAGLQGKEPLVDRLM